MIEVTAYDKITETGGTIALSWLVVKEVFAFLGKRKNGETKESEDAYKELKLKAIIDDRLQAFFVERDRHIRDIVRDELEKHTVK